MLTMLHDEGFDLNDCVLTAFGDPSTSRLRRVNLRQSTVTDLGLTALLKVSCSGWLRPRKRHFPLHSDV